MNTFLMNTRRNFERLLALAAALVALTVVPAAAQQASQAGAAPAAAPAASLPSWVKTCDTDKASKKEACIIMQELRADSGTFIASATVVRITGDKKYSLRATVPNGMLIKPGMKAQIDGGNPLSLVYLVCELHACLGGQDIDDAFLDSMKTGKTIVLTVFNQQGKPVTFSLPLAGFGNAFAGKALDADAFKKLQQARVEEFKARADAAREAMVKAQREQQGATPPAQ